MIRELGMGKRWVDKLFPQLDDLIIVHMNFYRQLQDLQNRRTDRLVEELGPTLKEQVLVITKLEFYMIKCYYLIIISLSVSKKKLSYCDR